MADILVFCEHADGGLKKSASELLGKAVELADGGDVTAVLIGSGASDAAAATGQFGAGTAYVVDQELSSPSHQLDALAAALEEARADVVLAPLTGETREILPRLAIRAEGAIATDVTDLELDGDDIVATRPEYAGKVLARYKLDSDVAIFAVRANSFAAPAAGDGEAEVEEVDADLGDELVELVEVVEAESNEVDLLEADRIISGGRSLGSAENFDILRSAAAVIGAAVGASRAAVDAGMATHSMQVGQTGKVVNPTLYFACGISGAIQHLAGMRTSKVIVAVNKDAEAPIFQHATYGIVDDLFDVVPALEAEFKKLG